MFSQKNLYPYFLVLPVLILILIVLLYPLFYLFYNSFFDFTLLLRSSKEFVGLHNYIDLVFSGDFQHSLIITLIYVTSSGSISFFLGFGIALVLSKRLRMTNLFRTIYLLPMVATPVIVALMWQQILNYRFGLMNVLLGHLGINGIHWLSKPKLALSSIIIADIWQWTPLIILILEAGLLSIPTYLYEAARIDGASAWQEFRYITLPRMRVFIGLAVVFRVIDLLRKVDKVYVMTEGGPGTSTEILSYSVFKTAFRCFDVGKAAALSFILLFIMGIVVTIMLRIFEVRF